MLKIKFQNNNSACSEYKQFSFENIDGLLISRPFANIVWIVSNWNSDLFFNFIFKFLSCDPYFYDFRKRYDFFKW